MRLETNRLIVRRPTEAEVESSVALWTNSTVMKHMGGPREPEKLRETLRAEIALADSRRFGVWSLIEKSTGTHIGDAGLIEKSIEDVPEIELVYLVTPTYWGRNLASEAGRALLKHARENLALKRVVALIDPANGASEAVAQKVGLRHEKNVLGPGGRVMRRYATLDATLFT